VLQGSTGSGLIGKAFSCRNELFVPIFGVDYLWYAAFGSNISWRRFETYLAGGSPPLLSSVTERGSRDRQPPTASEPMAVDHELYFGHTSRRWGGGVAVLDADTRSSSAGPTLCRLYRITVQQFEDVHCQENAAEHPQPLRLHRLLERGRMLQYEANYGLALVLGEHGDGLPIVTITTPRRVEAQAPGPAYLRTIAAGLVASMGLTTEDLVSYFLRKQGVASQWDASTLTRLLDPDVPPGVPADPG